MASLLVNFVYAHPVGHLIEALHACAGYHAADPELRIGLAVNAATPVELAALCPFIEAVYPVQIDLCDADLDARPWWPEYLRTGTGWWATAAAGNPTNAACSPEWRYYDECRGYFRGHIGYASPSVASWELMLDALTGRFHGATICLTGKLRSDGRTKTTVDSGEFDRLARRAGNAVLALDLPIVRQLAVVAACDVLVSPHSGFGMAALAVGTPWLSNAGNRWQEFYFNGTPFYSVLPDRDRFPCYTGMAPEPPPVQDDGSRSPSMSADRIRADLGEIVEAAAMLVERRLDYETALTDHVRRLLDFYDGDPAMVWSWDEVLAPHVAAAMAKRRG